MIHIYTFLAISRILCMKDIDYHKSKLKGISRKDVGDIVIAG